MKKPIAIQLTRDIIDGSYFLNTDEKYSSFTAMCMAFAATLNKEAKNALKLQFEISRSPFHGAKEIWSSSCVVGKKKKHHDYMGLPFSGSKVARDLFKMRMPENEGRVRFYAKLTVNS